MELSQLQKLNAIAMDLLKGEPINEAYHEKDKEVRKELADLLNHHYNMQSKHQQVQGALSKGKEISKHDLAILAHKFAASHYQNLSGFERNSLLSDRNLPEDYHHDRDFYDKLNNMVTKRADQKSRECGVACD